MHSRLSPLGVLGIALVIAGRALRERWLLIATFAAGQIAAALAAVAAGYYLAPRFLEAAAALTIAYLAVEILFLPGAGQRAIVVAVLGAFHGLAFAGYLGATEETSFTPLAGLLVGEVALFATLAAMWRRTRRPAAVSGILSAGEGSGCSIALRLIKSVSQKSKVKGQRSNRVVAAFDF